MACELILQAMLEYTRHTPCWLDNLGVNCINPELYLSPEQGSVLRTRYPIMIKCWSRLIGSCQKRMLMHLYASLDIIPVSSPYM